MRNLCFTKSLPIWILVLVFSGVSRADEDKSSAPVPKAAADTTSKRVQPLTEREQWLLEKVEQLEKRVAELASFDLAVSEGYWVAQLAGLR